MRTVTVGVWVAALASVAVAGVVATLFVIMPASLEPSEMIEAGTGPWVDALYAAAAFGGVLVAAVVGLRLWHTTRFRAIGLGLVLIELAAVAWACGGVYRDYL